VAGDRHEGHALGSRLEPREEAGSGVVEAADAAALGVAAEVRRGAELVEDELSGVEPRGER